MTLKQLLDTLESDERVIITKTNEIVFNGCNVYQMRLYKDTYLEKFEVVQVEYFEPFKIILVK